jgi:hypothetical protein
MEKTYVSTGSGGGCSTKIVKFDFDIQSLNVDYVEKKLAIKNKSAIVDFSNMVVRSNKPKPVKIEHNIGLEEFKKGGYAKKQKVVKVVQQCIH